MSPRPSTFHISNRLRQLCLSSPPPTALFYARFWHSFCPATELDHESLHILALCFLQAGQPYSALHLVRDTAEAEVDNEESLQATRSRRSGCFGCSMIVAKCCDRVSRFSEGKAVLDRAMKRSLPTSESCLGDTADRQLFRCYLPFQRLQPHIYFWRPCHTKVRRQSRPSSITQKPCRMILGCGKLSLVFVTLVSLLIIV